MVNKRARARLPSAISWVWKNKRFLPCDSVPLADRGFRYGMSVFESILVQNRTPIFLREHLARLQQACARCGFACDQTAFKQVKKLLRESSVDGFARIYVTAGDGSATGAAHHGRLFVFHESREPIPPRVYRRGYDLGMEVKPCQTLFNGLKTGNYWANLDAFRRGAARRKNETLLFNHAGELISACMANVFVVRRGKIKTPALASGARDGVVREWVVRQREVVECALKIDDLKCADEIFLTSSWLGIMPAASFEERALPDKLIARELRAEYETTLSTLSF